MGTYINTIKLSKTKKANLNGKEILVGIATFLCRQEYDSDRYQSTSKSAMTKAYNIPEEKHPDYIVFDTFDGARVFESNKLGVWSDGSGEWSGLQGNDIVGRFIKVGNKNYIVPLDVRVNDFMKTNFPKKYKTPLPSTQIYVDIHEGYTATVRDMNSFDEYINGWGKDNVDMTKLRKSIVGGYVPTWFEVCVDELIREKQKEYAKSLVVS